MSNYNKIVEILKNNKQDDITNEIESVILSTINNCNIKEKLTLIYSLYCYNYSKPDNSIIKKLLQKQFDILFEKNFNWNTFINSEIYLQDTSVEISKINFNYTISLFYNSFKNSFIKDYCSSSVKDKNNLLLFLSKIFLKNDVFSHEDSIKIWNEMGFNNKEKRDEFLFKINNLEQFQSISNVFNINLDEIGTLNGQKTFIGSNIIKNLKLNSKEKEISKKSFIFIFNYLKTKLEKISDKELKEKLLNNLIISSERFFNIYSDICFSSDFKKLDLNTKVIDFDSKKNGQKLGDLILKSRNLLKFHKYNKINKYSYVYESYFLFNIIPKKHHLLTVQKSYALELFNFKNIDFNKILEKYSEIKDIDFYFPVRAKVYLEKENNFDYFSFSNFYSTDSKENILFSSFINFFDLIDSNFKFNNNSFFMFLNKIVFSNISNFESLFNLKIEFEFNKFSNDEKKEIMIKLLTNNNFIKNFDFNCLDYHNSAINSNKIVFKKPSYCFIILNGLLNNCLNNKIYFNVDEDVINKVSIFSSYFEDAKLLIKNLSFISLSNSLKEKPLLKSKTKI